MNLTTLKIEKPDAINLILGQTDFNTSVEDMHEAPVGAVKKEMSHAKGNRKY